MAVVYLCIRRLLRVRKESRRSRELRTVTRLSSVLLLSFVAYAISSVFTSNVHEFYFPLLTGLSVALTVAAEREIRLVSKTRMEVAQPAPVQQRPRAAGNAEYAGRRLQVQR